MPQTQNAENGHNSQNGNGPPKTINLKELMSEGSPQGSDADYLEKVLKKDIAKEYLEQLEGEFAQANALGYNTEAEIYEARQLIRFRTNHFLQEHPPPGSKMQGSFRELVYGDEKEPLEPHQVRAVMAIEQALLSYVTMSRDMELQRLIKEMRSDQHVTREETESNANKLLGGLM